MAIQLSTLGRFAIHVDGEERESFLRRPLRSAVLLYLSVERETTREAAMAVFWPERSPDAARHALSQTLHKLRRDLGEDWIQLQGERLRVGAKLEVDVRSFEAAVRSGDWTAALDLYGGPFLDHWYLADASGFEEWVERRRAHLGRLYREAARAHIEERLSAGDLESAIGAARQWAAMEPFEAEPHHRLIEVLARTGNSAEVIHVWDEYLRRITAEELEPSPELTALVEEVRAKPMPVELVFPPRTSLPRIAPAPKVVRRARWLAGVGLATVAVILIAQSGFWDRGRPLAPGRVLVLPLRNLTGDSTLDRLGLIGADWILEGLSRVGVVRAVPITEALRAVGPAENEPGAVDDERSRELAAEALAETVVTGSYFQEGDQLVFRARVVSVEDATILGTAGPVYAVADSPLAAIDALRERVMGIVGVRYDPRLSGRFAGLDSGIPPPRYDAYRAYTDGLEAFLQARYGEAVPLFLRASELDSSFTRPLLLAATGFRAQGDHAHTDSIIEYLSARADRLTPYEAGALQWHRAKLNADADALLRFGRTVTELYPGTAGQFVAGEDALELHRPRLALHYFEGLDPSRGWTRDYFLLWEHMASAHHALGDLQAELRVAREAGARLPASICPLIIEGRALAALGRLEAIDQVIFRSLELPPAEDCSPGDVMLSAALELRAHGHADAARQLATRAVVWYRVQPADARSGSAPEARLARALYLAGRLDEAESVVRSLSAASPDNVAWIGRLGVLAARRGDGAEAKRIDGMLAGLDRRFLYGSHLAWRARIAAVLGEKDRAVAFLRDALSHGLPWNLELHADPDLEGLAQYPPFRRLMEPRG